MREIIFDTETTGFDPLTGDRMVEIGCIELINRVPTGETYHCYFNPQRDACLPRRRCMGFPMRFCPTNRCFQRKCRSCLSFWATPCWWRIMRGLTPASGTTS